MSAAYVLITVQALLGALDNLWHHEITERLPARRAASGELSLHAARELLYGMLFLGLAWLEWRGVWAALLATVLLAEIAITLADFVVEDRTRHLPALERVLHTILALTYGAVLAVLTPALVRWWQLPGGLVHTSHPFSWLFTVFGAGVLVWALRDTLAVLRLRQPPEWVRNPIICGSNAYPRTVLISGATGFIGGHLVRWFLARGDKVVVLTRRPEAALDRFGPHVQIVTSLDALDAGTRIEAIVNLAGSAILGMPWTRARRAQLIRSRVETTRQLTAFMARLDTPVRVFISASAIGYYGVRGDEVLDENARPQPLFQSRLCQEWETAARGAATVGARVVRLRLGLVLGADGGSLPLLALPIRLGLGAILGTGTQWVSWIHIDDVVRLIDLALDRPVVRSAINAVAPVPVTHRQLQEALARTLGRRVWLRIPGFLLRLMLGEMAQLLLDGQRIVPTRALARGWKPRHPTLDEALHSLLRPAAPDLSSAEVYFNGDCPVCRVEMQHYAALCTQAAPGLRFVDATRQDRGLAGCSLRREHLERRVYLRSSDGRMLSGMSAIMAIWASLPRYRLLARICNLPLLRQICAILYDHMLSPTLAAWARRRAVGATHAGRP
jgi:uncharacterized protein (TIGR01777 family)